MPGGRGKRCRTGHKGPTVAGWIDRDRDHPVMNGMLRCQAFPRDRRLPIDGDGQRDTSMTPDGVAPDLDCRRPPAGTTRAGSGRSGFADPAAGECWATDSSDERVRHVRVALIRARDELLRVHASTVLAMGRLTGDRAGMSDALAEARSRHEAIFLVGRAVDALTIPARPNR